MTIVFFSGVPWWLRIDAATWVLNQRHGRGPPVMEFTPLLIINLSNVNFRIFELKNVINQEI